MHRFKEAVEQFQKYISLKPNDPAGHHSLGMAYCELGEFALAVEPISQALRLGPEFGEVYHNLGLVYSELGRHEEAARAFQNAIRLAPNNADTHCALATSCLHLQAAKDALRLKPDSADAHFCLGCVLHELSTFVEAVTEYQKSLELNPGQFKALGNLGDAYLQLGRIEEARDALVQPGNIDSNDSKLHVLLGEVYLKLGERDKAFREYETLRKLDPSLADALAKLMDGLPES